MKRLILLAIVAILLAAGCSNPGTAAKELTECDAVKIARQELPAKISGYAVLALLHPQSGENARWSIVFPNVDVTREELGWVEDENTHLIWSGENSFTEGVPPDTYRNVNIYIDAVNGNVIGREANNGLLIGGPGMFSECP